MTDKITNQQVLGSIMKHPQFLSEVDKYNLDIQDFSSRFEKIIFLADKIEPRTRNKDYLESVRGSLDEENGLNKAMLICYKETIKSLVKRDLKICPVTIDIYNKLLEDL